MAIMQFASFASNGIRKDLLQVRGQLLGVGYAKKDDDYQEIAAQFIVPVIRQVKKLRPITSATVKNIMKIMATAPAT